MTIPKNETFLLATISQTFILFKRLMASKNWTAEKERECCELIVMVADLQRELARIVGIENAHTLVKDAYLLVFPEER